MQNLHKVSKMKGGKLIIVSLIVYFCKEFKCKTESVVGYGFFVS